MAPPTEPIPSLNLTMSFTQELKQLHVDGKLPDELVGLVTALINAEWYKVIPPEATPRLISLARKYLANGIRIFYPGDDAHHWFAVMIWVPDVANKESRRQYFQLIPCHPDGRWKHLDEIPYIDFEPMVTKP